MSKDMACDLLAKTNLTVFRLVGNKFREKDINVTPVQAKILMTIKDGCEYNQKKLKQIMACNKSTLSSILDTMEKNGLVLRYGDENDSRKKLIKLTNQSIDVIKSIEDEVILIDKRMHEIIGDDYDLFCDCLNKIYSTLKEEL